MRKRRKRRSHSFFTGEFLLGPTQHVQHRFIAGSALNPTGAAATDFPVSANGLFDPLATGGNHQPRGFDQLTPLYAQYTVLKAFCKCTFVNASAAATDRYVCGISLLPNVTLITSLQGALEIRQRVYKSMGPEDGNVVVGIWCNLGKFLGVPNPRNEDDMKGTASSVPSLEAFFHVWASSVVGSDPAPIDVVIDISYYTVWSAPQRPASSEG